MEHVWQPEVKPHRIDQLVCEEDLNEQHFITQERIAGLKQEDPEPQEEGFKSPEREHFVPQLEVLLLLMNGGNSTLEEDHPDSTIPAPQGNVCEEEEGDTEQQLSNQLNNQERISSVKQKDPEPPEVKEEQDEVFSSPEREFMPHQEDNGNTSDPVYEVLPLLVDGGDSKPDEDLQDSPITTPPESNPEPHTFNLCGKSDAYKLQLTRQLENHKDKQTFQQTEILSNQGQLANLERSSTVIRQDYHCPETSTRKTLPTIPMIGEKPFQCKICGERFTKVKDIRAHPRIHRKPLSCTYCGKEFLKQELLKKHQRIHTGEKPFSCSTCGKTFSVKGNLEIHLRTHTGEKPFCCSTCGKTFAAQSLLTVHVRTHTGEKPYSCNTCGRKFTQKSTLQVHERTHTGERPFSCSTCGENFTQRHYLRVHMRTHAKNGL